MATEFTTEDQRQLTALELEYGAILRKEKRTPEEIEHLMEIGVWVRKLIAKQQKVLAEIAGAHNMGTCPHS